MMLESLLAVGGIELGKAVLEQVSTLGKAALEDYVKDFFKDSIKSGIAAVQADTLKKALTQALGDFVKLFVEELRFHEVHETTIQHFYWPALKRFTKAKELRPLLGQAFVKDCKTIDTTQIAHLWQTYQPQGTMFPQEFDWEQLGKNYLRQVKGILRSNADLRAILEAELLEDIRDGVQRLQGISPGFEVDRYRHSLQCSYGFLKLYTLDSTYRTDEQRHISLWKMFIEQTVREALPPSRYELPIDLKRKLQAEKLLEQDLSLDDVEQHRREYFQRPSEKVLQTIAASDCQCAVTVGDPGAGKSTLLQYLALDWVEGKTTVLPLLIELREYVNERVPVRSVLQFLHQGTRADWQFDEQQLHAYLQQQPALVMFDGLDEVFNRDHYAAVLDEIVRFAQQYPQAKILVTSRVIGYNPERLQHAGFRHFTLQSLTPEEINEFIEKWYDLAILDGVERNELKGRLRQAIEQSPAIQNLADNPLLLTMMAILNRRQPLPKNRTDLYEQASRVLLYGWDVDYKKLQVPIDAIGLPEKQGMLRRIADEMQRGGNGLAGNLIEDDRLKRVVTAFLQEQGFSEPREKAAVIIQQLRERNFILCYRGGGTYSFVHRTFLEYFCAEAFLHRFEKEQSLSFSNLQQETFGHHWQEETWHEVLRLIAGRLEPKFTERVIEFLLQQQVDRVEFLDEDDLQTKQGLMNLLLAADCYGEVRSQAVITSIANHLLRVLMREIERQYPCRFNSETVLAMVGAVAQHWQENGQVFAWLKNQAENDEYGDVRRAAIQELAKGWKDQPETFSLLKDRALNDEDNNWVSTLLDNVRRAAIQELAKGWKDQPETFSLLKDWALNNENGDVRRAAVQELAKGWKNQPETFSLLKDRAPNDEDRVVRRVAVQELAKGWKDQPETFSLLKNQLLNDKDGEVRRVAVQELAKGWKDQPETFSLLKNQLLNDKVSTVFDNVRQAAMQELAKGWKDQPETFSLLKDRAPNDEDRVVRRTAVQELAKGWKDQPEIFSLLKDRALNDKDGNVRRTAVQELAKGWKDQPEIFSLLKDWALNDKDGEVRQAAVQELAKRWEDCPETFSLLKDRALNDKDGNVRRTAVQELAKGWEDQPGLAEFFYDHVLQAPYQRETSAFSKFKMNSRQPALAFLLKHDADRLRVMMALEHHAEHDSDEQLRAWASKKLEKFNKQPS